MRSKRLRGSDGVQTEQTQISDTNDNKLEDAKIVVGIDFGTSFSGFAYALKSDPEEVFTFDEWACHAAAGAILYCKTQTSLSYLPGKLAGTFELSKWGWPAYLSHSDNLQAEQALRKRTAINSSSARAASTPGYFFTKFKLHLAAAGSDSGLQFMNERLPEGFTAERLISDYLKQLSILILEQLRNKFGSHIVKSDVQWCLTVPAIWSDAAKQIMVNCSQKAGLVQGSNCQEKDASAHPIVIVLEPEAASVYCQHKLKHIRFTKGNKFLVVDVGGGTVDLVVHQKVEDSGVRVKEVARSSGDLCGSTFVDQGYMNYLAAKIDCFREFCEEYPTTVFSMKRDWENLKRSFNGQMMPYQLELPGKLARAREAHAKASGIWTANSQYDEVTITAEDMKMIFDAEVNKILKLIEYQLAQAPDVEAIMVVGGFSNSPYLMKRIRETFSLAVKHIVSPTDPGSAVCKGAVVFGALGSAIMLSRKSRWTYGMGTSRLFKEGDPRHLLFVDRQGEEMCKHVFNVFVRIGDDVPVDHAVSKELIAVNSEARWNCHIYATKDRVPHYTTDAGVVKVGSWAYSFPLEAQKMKEVAELSVTMYFGRSLIELFAIPRNFTGKKESLTSITSERDLF